MLPVPRVRIHSLQFLQFHHFICNHWCSGYCLLFEIHLKVHLRSSKVMRAHRQFFYDNLLQIEDREAKLAPLHLSRRDTSTIMQHDIPGSSRDIDLWSKIQLDLLSSICMSFEPTLFFSQNFFFENVHVFLVLIFLNVLHMEEKYIVQVHTKSQADIIFGSHLIALKRCWPPDRSMVPTHSDFVFGITTSSTSVSALVSVRANEFWF